MSSELHSILGSQEAKHEARFQGTAMDDIGHARLRRAAASASRMRALRIGAVAAAAAVAVALGAWTVADWQRGEEPLTPPTATSASPSPTEAPTTSAIDPDTGLALPGTVTPYFALPTAGPLPDGALTAATSGWVLASYSPRTAADTLVGTLPPPAPQVIYLVSPLGARYQVLELPTDQKIQVLAWDGNWALVGLTQWTSNFSQSLAKLDLTTGTLTPLDVPEASGNDVAMIRDLPTGEAMLKVDTTGPSQWIEVSALGAVRVMTPEETGEVTLVDAPENLWCLVVGIPDGDTVYQVCDDENLTTRGQRPYGAVLATASVSTRGQWKVIETFSSDEPYAVPSLTGVVVRGEVALGLVEPGPGDFACTSAVGLVGGGTLSTLASGLSDYGRDTVQSSPRDAADNSLFVEVSGGCSGGPVPTVLFSVPIDGGDPIELVPAPASVDPAAPEGSYPTVWGAGLSGWAVRH